MDVPQPRQLAPCRPAALCLLERGMAVLAGGGGHGLAPPWLQLHHTPTVAVQPAHSVAKLDSADCLTPCRGKRTILSPSLGLWRLSWLNKMMMSP